jgi:hypothetical protein
MTTEIYTGKFWEYLESDKRKKAVPVVKWTDYDNLNAIIVDGDRWHYETMATYISMPSYVFNYIDQFMQKQGYKYLFTD